MSNQGKYSLDIGQISFRYQIKTCNQNLSAICNQVLILGPDIRLAFTGPLVLKPEMPWRKAKTPTACSVTLFFFYKRMMFLV